MVEEKQTAEDSVEIEHLPIDELLEKLSTTREGLSTKEVQDRLSQYGPNSLPDKSINPLFQFLTYFWNPLSWAMEVAALLAIVLGDYVDFILIFGLLFLNACIGYWEEHSSGKAIEALKSQLAPTAIAKRDGEWQAVPSHELVPGDVIRVKGGDVIPADAKLVGEEIKLDMSSLTGESLPVTKYPGNEVFSGAMVKVGESDLVIYATGANTFFGRAASLVQGTNSQGHFQSILKKIGYFCIFFILLWVSIEMIIQFGVRWELCNGPGWGLGECLAANNLLVLIVGGIPIAMPTVLSVTMAIGAAQLAKKQAIVTRLTAVEELAGMDILCSDKTGTLTLNQLTLSDAEVWDEKVATKDDVLLHAALAASDVGSDAIDTAVLEKCKESMGEDKLTGYQQVKFVPFDPVSKRVIAHIVNPGTGEDFWVCKGAPQICLGMDPNEEIRSHVDSLIDSYAGRGYRTIGVCRSNDGENWTMEGLLPLFDPPRHDTKETIERAKALGIGVKMITGDQIAIAKETCRQLGISDNIQLPKTIEHYKDDKENVQEAVFEAGGFAGVYPEHKYAIIEILQDKGHFVGMTGDGVNDAPALKRADIGIAVSDATDAARAAADIVLLSPGLGVIIDAIIGSRKIFQRMNNYAMYAMTTTVRITLTFSLLTLIYDWYFTVILTVIIALLNDGTILTIAKDRVKPSPTPDHWNLPKLFFMALVFGTYLSAMTICLFSVANDTDVFVNIGMKKINRDELRALMYLYVSITGQMVIFITRAHGWFFLDRPSWMLMAAFVFAQIISTIIAIFGFNGYPFDKETDFVGCGWDYAIVAWIWSIITFIPLDPLKFISRLALNVILHPLKTFERPYRVVSQGTLHPVYGNQASRGFSPLGWNLSQDLPSALEVGSVNLPPPTTNSVEWPRPSVEFSRSAV